MPASTENQELFAIADLANEFKISTRTIRYYESKGLISPERLGTTRVFRRRDRARLNLILRGKRLGFSLRDIEEYLSLYDVNKGKHAQEKMLLELVDQRIDLLKRQMNDLKITLSELKDIKKSVEGNLQTLAAE